MSEQHAITIRKVTLADAELLQQISRQTFYETFAEKNTKENMSRYLEHDLSLQKLRAELEVENAAFYFAENNNRIVGYLKVNFGDAQTELQDKNALEIERIYVITEYHGKQVGQLLYNVAIDLARQQQAEYIWLGVWEKNERAIHFYRKNGFVEFGTHVFKLGDDKQTDILMKCMLV